MNGFIAKKWLDYQARHLPELVPGLRANTVEIATLAARDAFYAGALVTAQSCEATGTREEIVCECADFFERGGKPEPKPEGPTS